MSSITASVLMEFSLGMNGSLTKWMTYCRIGCSCYRWWIWGVVRPLFFMRQLNKFDIDSMFRKAIDYYLMNLHQMIVNSMPFST